MPQDVFISDESLKNNVAFGLNEDQILINIEKVANTTAGTIPIGLSEAVLNKRLKKGDLLLISAFGAGFTWGAMLIRWGKCV